MSDNSILSEKQFGFKKCSSTTLAIFYLLSDVMQTFNMKNYTIGLFLDLRKAFDNVNKTILLSNLWSYGIVDNCHSLFDSYLLDRSQYVEIDGVKSNVLPVSL